MTTRLFSALAAVAMSTAIAGTAMARDAGNDTVPATQATRAPQAGQQPATQSAQAFAASPSTYGITGAYTAAQQPTDANDATGVVGVKVGPGPGYAWWKDR